VSARRNRRCTLTLVGVLLAWSAGSAAARTRATVEVVASRSVSGAERVTWVGELRRGRWRCDWRARLERQAALEHGLSISGPGRRWLRGWVVGRFRLRTVLGTAGLATLPGGHRTLQLLPAASGSLEGFGLELGHGRWSAVVVGAWPSAGSERADRSRTPALTLVGGGLATRHASLAVAVARRVGPARVPAPASILLAVTAPSSSRELRCAMTLARGRGSELRIAARRLGPAGEFRLDLERRLPGAVDLLALPAGVAAGGIPEGSAAASDERAGRQRLLGAWRLRRGAWQVAAQSLATHPDPAGGRLRVDLVRTMVPGRHRLESRCAWSDEGAGVRLRLASPDGRLAWARATPHGMAWSGRLARRPLTVATLAIEVRGWRGGAAGRRAATLLGPLLGTSGSAAPTLAAAGSAGTITACQLDLQRTSVRVRLALAARDVSGRRPEHVASARVQWRLD
jgi:hypothetical protein